MIAEFDHPEDTATNIYETGTINGNVWEIEALGIEVSNKEDETGKIVFEKPKPNPSSKEGRRLKRSGKPF